MTDSSRPRAGAAEGGSARTARRGIKLFRGNDGIPLEQSGMMSAPVYDPEDQKALAEDGPRSPTVALGIDTSVVFRGEGPNGSSLARVWLAPHFVLPRHSHSADCLYYVAEGTITMGSQTLTAGDGFFVPSDAPYAYEAGPDGAVVLEFRTCTSFDMQIPGGQLERWRRMATIAEEQGDRWIELRSQVTA